MATWDDQAKEELEPETLLGILLFLGVVEVDLNLWVNSKVQKLSSDFSFLVYLLSLGAGSCAIDYTQLGHQKCFGTKGRIICKSI